MKKGKKHKVWNLVTINALKVRLDRLESRNLNNNSVNPKAIVCTLDVNKDIADDTVRLRDENALLHNTLEVLTYELERYRAMR